MRAKFYCDSVKTGHGHEEASLRAISDGDTEENSRFAQATPTGELKITIDNLAALGFLIPGRSYYLDFTLANDDGTKAGSGE